LTVSLYETDGVEGVMILPKKVSKGDLILGLIAAASVVLSGLVMNRLTLNSRSFVQYQPLDRADQLLEVPVSQNAIAPSQSPDMPAIAVTQDACAMTLDLLDDGNGMVGGTLVAPCLPSQDMVIAHAGMVFSAKTLASGVLFFKLPALKTPAAVHVRFANGDTVSAQVDIPEAGQMQRLVVQWPYADGFNIHAFENSAGFGSKGHIWLETANTPVGPDQATQGYLTALGDSSVDMPLMVQVYTFAPKTKTEIMLEVPVTANTCASEVMGDIISVQGGISEKTEVTLTMPDCSAIGEFVYLGLPDLSMDLAMAQ
jgi:hypothetical protein